MNYEPELIRARFVEAAFTERFLPTARTPEARGYWPEFIHDKEDREGWDDQARIENADTWRGRASNGAISRHQECLDWTAQYIEAEKWRPIVWAWAFCRANGWDFGARCVKKGWARPTAYRRLTASFDLIACQLRNERSLLRLPDEKYLRQEQPVMACVSGRMGQRDDTPAAIKFTPGYQTEPSRDLIQTQDDADTFAKFLERRNARMRKINGWRNEQVA